MNAIKSNTFRLSNFNRLFSNKSRNLWFNRIHLDERLVLGPAWDGHVERLGGEEGLEVEQVEVVVVDQVGHQLVGHAVEARDLRQGQVPLPEVRDKLDNI